MFNLVISLAIVSTCALQARTEGDSEGATCLDVTEAADRVSLSVQSQRNETGKWLTTFDASHDSGDGATTAKNIAVDVSHSVAKCQGKTRMRVRGVLAEESRHVAAENLKMTSSDALLFDPKCGSNVAVLKDRRTVRKINLDVALDSIVFTHRPLKDEEVFEVRLDKKHTKFTYSLGIGATTHSPKDITLSGHINHLPPPSWAMYHGHIYQNGSLVFKNYGRDLNALVVGDRVGVMRSVTGNLHFYVNGVDQGPAASNVPPSVYGVLELWHNAAAATIVH